MKTGIISDTHHYLNPLVLKVFHGVDLVLHGGDVGSEEILLQLRTIAPVIAVKGNMDNEASLKALPLRCQIEVEDKRIFITHDIGNIAVFHQKVLAGRIRPEPDIVVFGHTHQAFYKQLGKVVYINPGSATSSRDSRKPSVVLLDISPEGEIAYQLIEL